MSLPGEPGSPELPRRLPTRELLLAQALEACITAERRVPGSAQATIARQPAWARRELQWMMRLAASLDGAATSAAMSPEWRAATRMRLVQAIGGEAVPEPVVLRGRRLTALQSGNGHQRRSWRRSAWLWRGSAGGLAALLGLAATLTASASALPGEPLYALKQAHEALDVRLAADDQARALALLGQADARLDETSRLLQQGRTDAAVETAQRYGQSVERAMTTYVVSMDETPAPVPATLETRLTQEQGELQTILQTAPEPARADLREALLTTERGRALVTGPRPVELALGTSGGDGVSAAAVPTSAAEDLPTPALVPADPAPILPAAPSRSDTVVAEVTQQPAAEAVVAQQRSSSNRGGDSGSARTQNGGARAQAPSNPVVAHEQRTDDVPASPSLLADAEDGSDRGGTTVTRGPTTSTRGDTGAAPTDGRPATQQHDDRGSQPVVAHEAGGSQAVVAHQAAVTAAESRSGGTGDKPALKVQATPTPTRRGDATGPPRPTAVTARNSSADPHPGNGNGGGNDNGHHGNH